MSRRGATRTLYVRNISERVRYDDLQRLFSKYGKIVDVTLPLDYYARVPKGYCFVEFEAARDAEEALYRIDRQPLFGRELEVEFARGDRKTPSEMRSREVQRRYAPRNGYDSRRSRSRSRSPKHHRRSRSRSGERRRSRSSRRERNHRDSRSRSRSAASSTRNRSVSRERSQSQNGRSVSPPLPTTRKQSTSPVHDQRARAELNHSRSRSRS